MFVEEKVAEQLLHKKANNLRHELQSAKELLDAKEQSLVEYQENIMKEFQKFSQAVENIIQLINEGKPVPESYFENYLKFSRDILKGLQDEFLSEQHIGEDYQKAIDTLKAVNSLLDGAR